MSMPLECAYWKLSPYKLLIKSVKTQHKFIRKSFRVAIIELVRSLNIFIQVSSLRL